MLVSLRAQELIPPYSVRLEDGCQLIPCFSRNFVYLDLRHVVHFSGISGHVQDVCSKHETPEEGRTAACEEWLQLQGHLAPVCNVCREGREKKSRAIKSICIRKSWQRCAGRNLESWWLCVVVRVGIQKLSTVCVSVPVQKCCDMNWPCCSVSCHKGVFEPRVRILLYWVGCWGNGPTSFLGSSSCSAGQNLSLCAVPDLHSVLPPNKL